MRAARRIGAPRWILVLAFVLRAAVALFTDAIVQPDEIYQYVEQAHRLVFGWGFIPWEFQHGARSWRIAGAIAPILKACALVGLGGPGHLPAGGQDRALRGQRDPFPCSAYRIGQGRRSARRGRARRAGRDFDLVRAGQHGRVARFPTVGIPASIGALSVMLGAAPPPRRRVVRRPSRLALGAALPVHPGRRGHAGAVAAILGAAIVRAVAAFAVVAILSGALDAVTLGEWFGSVIENVRFNIVDGMARTFGVAPPYQYLDLAGGGVFRFGRRRRAWPRAKRPANLAGQLAALDPIRRLLGH